MPEFSLLLTNSPQKQTTAVFECASKHLERVLAVKTVERAFSGVDTPLLTRHDVGAAKTPASL